MTQHFVIALRIDYEGEGVEDALVYTSEQWEEIYQRNVDTVYRVCFVYLKNRYDAEDAVQNTFLRLMGADVVFENPTHEKAWLIRTASNLCKDFYRHWWQKTVGLDAVAEKGEEAPPMEDDEVLRKVMALPRLQRLSILYFYYEGYSTGEIAVILDKKESTVRSYLHRGRNALKLTWE